MTRSKHRRHAKSAGKVLMIDDDAQLARAAEAFFAEALERERTTDPAAARLVSAPVETLPDERGMHDAERPDEHERVWPTSHDERHDDGRRPESRRVESRREAPSAGPAVIIDGDAWRDVVQSEAARWQRHGGSVAVFTVRLAPKRPAPAAVDPSTDSSPAGSDPLAAQRYAVPLGDVLRNRARASDPVARVAADQFSVLLLEADEAGASAYAERIRQICEPWVTAVPGDLALRIGWAVPGAGGSIQGAAEDAFSRVESQSL